MSAPGLPSGTVTFLFTDVEGSTRLLERLGEAYAEALLEHRRVVREAFAAEGGVEVDTQGDAFFVAFPSAGGAAAAALAAQAALAVGPIRVRMGLHTGEPQLTSEGYVGMDVHRGARIAAAGHGGQILVSEQTQKLLGERGDLRDLGRHRLKDMGAAERIFQLGDGEFASLKSLNQTNLPVQLTAFVGRARMLDEIVALIRREDVRLVTLLGPGGSGKTRLGLEVAAESVEDYPDGGVWYTALAALTDPDLMLPAIAQALGLRDSGESALDLLTRHVRGRATLLVIDNLEQLLPAAAQPLAELLARCPRLKLLVTSREPLRVAGEREFAVTPFARDEAVAFFADRVRAVRPDFTVGDENRAAVEAVCARLDDLPLAVELAAARVKVLPPTALLARLEQRLPLLVGGARDAPERQRTLRGAIAWSHDLLPASEQALFARLAVFVGGWTLDAAEEVCGAGVDELEALIDKSLVVAVDSPEGDARFTMLETIREFALEQLEAGGGTAALRRRHAEFHRGLAEQAETGLKGRDQAAWLARLEAEHDNLRASLEWSIAEEPPLALSLAGDLWLFWYMRGHVSEGRTWLGRALDRADATPSAARARALDGAGYLALEQGDWAAGQALLEESLSCARRLDSAEDIATAACHLASCFCEDDPERARALGEEAVALARQAGNRYVLAMALNNFAGLMQFFGEPDRPFLEESYRLRLEAGDASRIALSLINLADSARQEHDTREARRLLEEALEGARGIGDRRHVCFALEGLGWTELAEGDFEQAGARLTECLLVARELGQLEVLVSTLYGLAAVAGGSDDSERAARLAAAAQVHRHLVVVGDPAERNYGVHRPHLEAARARVSRDAWESASAEGAAMSLDDAISYALGETA